MRILGRPWLFELGAGFYAWFTANRLWRQSCGFLATFFPKPNGHQPMRVLDLGCGPGVTALTLAEVRPDVHYIGLDLAPRMVRIAHDKTLHSPAVQSISYVVADATALPFSSDAFDATTGHSFLYLVPDRAGVLEEAYRVLRRGGRYISMEPRDGETRRGALRRHWHDLRYMVSVLLWRPYSKYHGRLDEKSFPQTLERAGFEETGTAPVLDGLGIVGYGEKKSDSRIVELSDSIDSYARPKR